MKKLFLPFAFSYLQAILLIFYCTFASCQSKEIDKTNQNKADKSAEDSLKNLREKIDTNNQKTDKTDNNSNDNLADKSAQKKPQKLDSIAIFAKITKKWEITGNYWVSSIETFNNNENYFLDLQKDGSYTLKARLEDINISETGKWQLQNPKLKFRKYEETDSKDAGIPIEDNEEILVLMPKSANNNKERLFLFNFSEKEFAFNMLTRPSGLFAK